MLEGRSSQKHYLLPCEDISVVKSERVNPVEVNLYRGTPEPDAGLILSFQLPVLALGHPAIDHSVLLDVQIRLQQIQHNSGPGEGLTLALVAASTHLRNDRLVIFKSQACR